jgi:hypothetical protein
MADFQNTLVDVGGAVSDLFGAQGARIAAGSYKEAQSIAEQNAVLARQATRIKDIQISRNIFRTLGEQQAQVGGAGMAASGSALDILRSSASEGAITRAVNEEQGAITANAYEEQAAQFGGMADAAKSSATGQTIGGIIMGGGAIANLTGALGSAGGGADLALLAAG